VGAAYHEFWEIRFVRATHFSPFRRDPEGKPKDSTDKGIDDDDSLTISGIEEIFSLKILSFNN
jgi:hypothetical protein